MWCERAALKTGRAPRFVAKLARRKQMEAAYEAEGISCGRHTNTHLMLLFNFTPCTRPGRFSRMEQADRLVCGNWIIHQATFYYVDAAAAP